MKKIIKVLIYSIFLYVFLSIFNNSNAADLSVSTSTTSTEAGKPVTITISSDYTGRFNITSDEGTLSESTVWIEKNSKTIELRSDKATDANVTITATTLSDSEGKEIDELPTKTIHVNFKEKEENNNTENNSHNDTNTEENTNATQEPEPSAPAPQEPAPQAEEPKAPTETKKSSNANLSNLGIRPNDFKGFKPGTLDYSVNVPNNVEKINVYATAQDKNAKIISGTGSQNLNVGNNAIKVVVKAEDGTEKTYTINVAREEKKEEENKPENEVAEETTVENVEENQVKSDLVKLEIEGQKLTPSFSADVYEYKLSVSKDIESLNVITEGANENINIEVAGNKELKEGENLITILVYNNETKQNSTYQILVNKASAEPIETEDVNPILNSTIKKAKRNRYIVIGIGVFILVGIIVFIIVKNRNQDEDDEEYDEEYDEDQNTDEANHDERIDLSEDEGLFRRVNREDFKLESKTSQKSINNENQEKITSKANFEKNPNDSEDRDIRKKGRHF